MSDENPWSAGSVTVAQLLRHAGSLAIPAFQRGSVWSDSGRAELLSSLSKGYFVGSLLVWRPATPPTADDGACPVVSGSQPRFLLLDGQQRVRALLQTLAWPAVDAGTRRPDDPIWCVVPAGDGLNFARLSFRGGRRHVGALPTSLLPSVRAVTGGNGNGRGVRFVAVPAWRGPNGTECAATEYPLDTAEEWIRTVWRQGDHAAAAAALDDAASRLLAARVDVRLLEEGGSHWSEREVIDNYRRLNQSGSRLRDEELEFARLVAHAGAAPTSALAAVLRCWPDTDSIDDQRAHDSGDEAGSSAEEFGRDNLLERGDDRQFGLSLFVRSVRIARDDYENAREEQRSSVGDPRPEDIAYSGLVREWVGRASAAITALACAFVELGCDWRARIPRRHDLGTLVALLIRFPELGTPRQRAHLRMLVLGLHLRPDSTVGDSEGPPSSIVRDSLSASEAVERLDRWLAVQAGEAGARIRHEFTDDHTPSHRLVDLYYWWLRAQDAPDLHPDPTRCTPLTWASSPERQHILPFAKVDHSKDEPAPRRNSRHLVNSIGNLTWISSHANTCMPVRDGAGVASTGWGDRFMVAAPAAAAIHLLIGELGGDYDTVRLAVDAGRVSEGVLAQFCNTRAQRVADVMVTWWLDMVAKSRELRLQTAFDNTLPAPTRMPSRLHLLFGWGYPPEFARLVHRLMRLTVYATSDAAGWQRDASRHRLRRRGRHNPDLAAITEFRFEFRRRAEDRTHAPDIVVSPSHIELPSLVTGTADPAERFAVPAECSAAAAIINEILRGW